MELKLAKRRVLLAGGSGFIGRNLSIYLLNKGYTPVVVDWVEPKVEGVEYHSADIRTLADLFPSLLESVDVLYLLAWSTKPQSADNDPAYDLETNVLAGIHLLNGLVRLKKQPRVIFLSTGGAVYGDVKQQPILESTIPAPTGAYGIGKWTFEQYLALYYRLFKLDYLIYRPGNPYGIFQDSAASQGAVAVFLGKVANNQSIDIWGDGQVVRDYLYIDDLTEALYQGISYEIEDGVRVFNVGSSIGVSLKDLISEIEKSCGVNVNVNYLEGRKVDLPCIVLDCSNTRKYLNWYPKVSLAEGLKKAWHWVQESKLG